MVIKFLGQKDTHRRKKAAAKSHQNQRKTKTPHRIRRRSLLSSHAGTEQTSWMTPATTQPAQLSFRESTLTAAKVTELLRRMKPCSKKTQVTTKAPSMKEVTSQNAALLKTKQAGKSKRAGQRKRLLKPLLMSWWKRRNQHRKSKKQLRSLNMQRKKCQSLTIILSLFLKRAKKTLAPRHLSLQNQRTS